MPPSVEDAKMMASHAAMLSGERGSASGPVSYTTDAPAAPAGGRVGLGGTRLAGGGAKDKGADDIIVIHVCDDNRRINRDFYCSRELLLQHMTYFTPYLADVRGLPRPERANPPSARAPARAHAPPPRGLRRNGASRTSTSRCTVTCTSSSG